VSQVGAPCLIASTLTSAAIGLDALGQMAVAAIAVFAAVAALCAIGLRVVGLPYHSYLPALMFPNAGNMGLPLCLFAFGEPGLALAIVFVAVSSVLQFTVGVGLAAGTASPGRLARIPLLYAVGISLAVVLTGTAVPGWIA